MDIFSTCDSPDWLSYLHYYVLFVKYNDDISEFPKVGIIKKYEHFLVKVMKKKEICQNQIYQ